ncbi:MAG: hypothetical protein WBO35_01840 [Candidatus Saccharimonadales bacterium]
MISPESDPVDPVNTPERFDRVIPPEQPSVVLMDLVYGEFSGWDNLRDETPSNPRDVQVSEHGELHGKSLSRGWEFLDSSKLVQEFLLRIFPERHKDRLAHLKNKASRSLAVCRETLRMTEDSAL